ncbi:MAG TPA: radical SAM protein [Candidatus Hydrogenedens sp.]|nr:radical SAM protein [Candidatus Hydrogenedens sp.]HOL20026.1 radical SAM protein [Candidatus Hydrogenedens sp.]
MNNRDGVMESGKFVLYGWDNLSTNDGPGVRLALYFKGCSLRCPWCLNPFLQDIKPEIRWKKNKCVQDYLCVNSCKQSAIYKVNGNITIDYEKCNFCGVCWDSCKEEALKHAGDYISLEQILSLVEYEINLQIPPRNITIGGGEPLLHGCVLIQLIDALKKYDVNVILTSCSAITSRDLWKSVLEKVDGILLQMVTIDEEVWNTISDVPFDTYLRNLHDLTLSEKPIYIRIPIVHGFSDNPELIGKLCSFIKHALPNTQQVEFRGYSSTSSYNTPLFSLKSHSVSSEEVMKLCVVAKEMGLSESHWRGALRTLDNSQIHHLVSRVLKDY